MYLPDNLAKRSDMEVDARPAGGAGGMRDEGTDDVPYTTAVPEEPTTAVPATTTAPDSDATTTDAPTDEAVDQLAYSLVEIRSVTDDNMTTATPKTFTYDNLTTAAPMITLAATTRLFPADTPHHHEALASDITTTEAPAADVKLARALEEQLPPELRGFAKYASEDVEADFAPFDREQSEITTAEPFDPEQPLEANLTSSVLNITQPSSSLLNITTATETVLELPADVDLYAKSYANEDVRDLFESVEPESLLETARLPPEFSPAPDTTTPCELCTACSTVVAEATSPEDCTEACRLCSS